MPATAQEAPATDCSTGDTRLLTDFEGAGGSDCARTDSGFVLTVSPETTPINRSPWYAFDLVSQDGGEVSVQIDYTYGEHRYVPKVEVLEAAGGAPTPVIVTEDRGESAILSMTIAPGRYRISAQPVISVDQQREWAMSLAATSDFEFAIAGQSRLGRDIWRLTAANTDSPLSVLLLGGQHPPEVPGSVAMRAFMERVALDDELANAFRTRFRIHAFPLLNPDGVALGHWRTTTGLQDLNRDWGVYSQIESHIVGSHVYERWQEGERPVLMIDFHATRVGDVLYVPQGDAPGVEPFLSRWIARIDAAMGQEPAFEPVTGNNPGLPTARSWFTRTFARPGVTLEIGDETDPLRTRRLAEVAAEAMMRQLLEEFPQTDNP